MPSSLFPGLSYMGGGADSLGELPHTLNLCLLSFKHQVIVV